MYVCALNAQQCKQRVGQGGLIEHCSLQAGLQEMDAQKLCAKLCIEPAKFVQLASTPRSSFEHTHR